MTYFNYNPEELLYYYNRFPDTDFFRNFPTVFHNCNHNHTELLLILIEKNPKLDIFKRGVFEETIFYYNDYEEVLKKYLELNPDVTLKYLLSIKNNKNNTIFIRGKHEDTIIELIDKDPSFDVMLLFEKDNYNFNTFSSTYDKLLKKIILENPNLDIFSLVDFNNGNYVECLKLWMEKYPDDDPLQFDPCNEFILWYIEKDIDFDEENYYGVFCGCHPTRVEIIIPFLKKAKNPHKFMELLFEFNTFHYYKSENEIIYYLENHCNGIIPEWFCKVNSNKLTIFQDNCNKLANKVYEIDPKHPIFKINKNCMFYHNDYNNILEKIPQGKCKQVRKKVLENVDIPIITEEEEELEKLNSKTLCRVLLKKLKDPEADIEKINNRFKKIRSYDKDCLKVLSLINIKRGKVSYELDHIENILDFIIEGVI